MLSRHIMHKVIVLDEDRDMGIRAGGGIGLGMTCSNDGLGCMCNGVGWRAMG